MLFAVVAIVTGQLANRVREHVREARQREEEMKALYFFSRRLAVASGPADIHAAIEDHLSAITGCRIALFAAGAGHSRPEASPQWREVPGEVQRAILGIVDGTSDGQEAPLTDRATGASWLIRILSQRKSAVGILAIELGRVSQHGIDAIRQRVDAALAEAAATLERIDVAHAIGEAKVRSEAATLRAALIGSVSHELGTPLASILGSASVLAQAPSVAHERTPCFARRHHPRRERAPQHRHPEPARRQPDQRRGRAGAPGLGGATRHRQRRAGPAAPAPERASRRRAGGGGLWRSCASIRCWSSRR